MEEYTKGPYRLQVCCVRLFKSNGEGEEGVL